MANPVLVPKKDTTALRMCIDYTGLNKHCSKDHFPLPRIDQIVDSTAGCDRLSFLDAYSGYNQIKLKVKDQEQTAFITPGGVCCYNVMTFGLKNAGATYQRCMQACLNEQIGRNIEVTARHDERGLLLIFDFQLDLVVTRVSVEEGESIAARRRVDDVVALKTIPRRWVPHGGEKMMGMP